MQSFIKRYLKYKTRRIHVIYTEVVPEEAKPEEAVTEEAKLEEAVTEEASTVGTLLPCSPRNDVYELPLNNPPAENANDTTEETICSICLTGLDSPKPSAQTFVTSCNHIFCMPCMLKLFELKGQGIVCPMCRQSFHTDLLKNTGQIKTVPLFDESMYPDDANFDFIECEYTQKMVSTAYATISKLKRWQYLHDLFIRPGDGFMTTYSEELYQIMFHIEEDYHVFHSGCTWALTMRNMQYIAKYGFDSYRIMYIN